MARPRQHWPKQVWPLDVSESPKLEYPPKPSHPEGWQVGVGWKLLLPGVQVVARTISSRKQGFLDGIPGRKNNYSKRADTSPKSDIVT